MSTSTVTSMRRVGADPASVALLLAGPAAAELWTPASVHAATADIVMEHPYRAGVGFAADVTVCTAGRPTARGRLTIVPDTDPGASCVALSIAPLSGDSDILRRRCERFLGALANVARARATAA